MKLSAHQFFILGMIASIPPASPGISGTTLNELLEQRNVKEWTRLGFSKIYYIVNQLEKKKLIKKQTEEKLENLEVGAPQKQYIITREGKRLLKKTLITYLKQLDLNYTEFNIALSVAHILTPKELHTYMVALNQKLEARLTKIYTRYTDGKEELPPDEMPFYVWALFNHAFYMLKAKKAFLDTFILKLDEQIKREEKS